MTAPSPDRAPDEIERKLVEIENCLAGYSRTGDVSYLKWIASWIPFFLATLRETRRELAAIRGERETTGGCRAGVTMPNGDTGTR